MAGDRSWCSPEPAGQMHTLSRKVFKFPNGALYGGAEGFDDRALRLKLLNVQNEHDLPTSKWLARCKDAVTALLALPDGTVWWIGTGDEEGGVMPMELPFAAIGSGQFVAIGAMEHGATAEQACYAACKHSVYCREPVDVIHLVQPKLIVPNWEEVAVPCPAPCPAPIHPMNGSAEPISEADLLGLSHGS
jgi:hypothetical protein